MVNLFFLFIYTEYITNKYAVYDSICLHPDRQATHARQESNEDGEGQPRRDSD